MSSSVSPFVMYCELSGEPLSLSMNDTTGDNAIVVTPSGHVCRKRLLLTKLLENGGMDPFVPNKDRPLQEDDLITLQQPSTSANNSNVTMPPKSHPLGEKANNNTSSLLTFSSTLSRLQTEYDAVLLDLFDTRQALTETRRELSQALYQNDAAVRVVARLMTERDAARQAQTFMTTASTGQEQEQQVTKKRKIETTTTTTTTGEQDMSSSSSLLWNDISATDMESMQAAWEGLHKNRKSWQKQAASKAPSKTDLAEAFHATSMLSAAAASAFSGGGILAMTSSESSSSSSSSATDERIIVTMNDKNQVHLYNVTHQKVVAELETSSNTGSSRSSRSSISRPTITAMDHYYYVDSSSESSFSKICLALTNGSVQVFRTQNNNDNEDDDNNKKKRSTTTSPVVSVTAFGTCEIPVTGNNANNVIADVRFHPDGQHIVAAMECGMVALLRQSSSSPDDNDNNNNNNNNNKLVVVSMFDSKNYKGDIAIKITCGCLHPDGLIYLVGCSTGEIYLWDFRSKTLLIKPLTVVVDGDDDVQQGSSVAAAVQHVVMSPNGYHIAALYGNNDNTNNEENKDNGIVRIWDLRKQTCLATLNAPPPPKNKNDKNENDGADDEDWFPARCVAFDVSGKYVAYGVSSSSGSDKKKKKNNKKDSAAAIHVVAVKEWNQIAASWKLDGNNNDNNAKLSSPMTGLIWTSPEWLATCSSSSGNNFLFIGKDNGKDESMQE